jgi:hypothetical protein
LTVLSTPWHTRAFEKTAPGRALAGTKGDDTMKRLFILALAGVMTFGLVATAQAAGGAAAKRAENPAAFNSTERGAGVKTLPSPIFAGGSRATQAVGTIQYDNGTLTAIPAVSSFCYGNRFNTAAGNPLTASGTITQLSWFMTSGAGTDSVFISYFDQLAGTAANVITSVSVPAPNPGGFNTRATTVNYVGSTFLAGVWYIAGDTPGLGSGTTGGQGHHGMLINDIVGTGYQSIANINGLVRASGNVVTIPVELTGFEVVSD